MTPSYRFKLRARIHEKGFRLQQDFARTAGIDSATLSRVLHGREIPTPAAQKAIADGLGITIAEFEGLLE